jgi:putative hydrolase of the HAD superfamily
VFDLGRVLFDFSHQPFIDHLCAHGAVFADTADFLKKTRLLDFEHGLVTADEFIALVTSNLTRLPDRAELVRCWQDIFTPIEPMLAFQRSLRGRYRVYILSNASVLHWDYLCDRYHLKSLADDVLGSFEVFAMKPEPEIYRAAEVRFDLVPAQTVFIDDVYANVIGAREAGWHAFQHCSPEESIAQFASLGVK